MFTIAEKKEPQQLLQKFLKAGYPSLKSLAESDMESGLGDYARTLGMPDAGHLAGHLFGLPFREMLAQVRKLMIHLTPPFFLPETRKWDEITRLAMEESIWGDGVFDRKKTIGIVVSEPLNVIEIDCASGEGIYSAVINLRFLLAHVVKANLWAVESDESLLNQALENSFSGQKISRLGEEKVEQNFRKYSADKYSVFNEFSHAIKFLRWDALSEDLGTLGDQKFQLMLCRNLGSLYPREIACRIIEKLIPHVRLEGLMLPDFPDGDFPEIEGLDTLDVNGVKFYQRNRKPYNTRFDLAIERRHDSVEGIAAYTNFLLSRREHRKAVEEMEKITSKRHKSPALFHLLGDLFLVRSEYHEALRRYNRAVLADKDFLPSYFNTVLLNLINGNHDQAIIEGRKLLQVLNTSQIDPSAWEGLFNVSHDQMISYCRKMVDILKEGDSLSLESMVLDLMQIQGNERLIPLQTGAFQSLINRQSSRGGISPIRLEAQAKIVFLDDMTPADMSKFMKQGQARQEAGAGADAPPPAAPRETPVPARQEEPEAAQSRGFYTSTISRDFVAEIEELIENEEYAEIIGYLNRTAGSQSEAQKDVARLIAKLSINSKKLKSMKDGLLAVMQELQSLMND